MNTRNDSARVHLPLLSMRRFSRRGGFTLVEIALGLVIAFISTAVMLKYMAFLSNQQNARAMSTREVEIVAAANNYLNANIAAVYADAAGGPLAIPIAAYTYGGAQPTAPFGLQTLQGAGFLPPIFIDTNAYQQHTYLIVRQGTSSNTVEGVILTVGGSPAPDEVLGMASRYIGSDGGAVLTNPPTASGSDIMGYKGGWVAPAANFTVGGIGPTPGHVAAYVVGSNNQIIGDFLWRNNIGIPEANTMHTQINMTHNDINNLEQITGGGGTVAADDAIHMANTIVPAISPLPDASLAGAPTEYQKADGSYYQTYIRPDGNTRLSKLDTSTIVDATAWDPQGGIMPRNYPVGMRLIDALPMINIMASYYAQDGQIVPMPQCGPPGNFNYGLARIFAMPISNLDVVAPEATTSNLTYYTVVPVIDTADLTESGTTITLTTTSQNINSITTNNPDPTQDGVISNTVVDPTGVASAYYASADLVNKDWVFHINKRSGLYETPNNTVNPGAETPLPVESYDPVYLTAYPNVALVETACYFGP